MKEKAKLYKTRVNIKQHTLGKRLGNSGDKDEEMKFDDSNVVKRKKGMESYSRVEATTYTHHGKQLMILKLINYLKHYATSQSPLCRFWRNSWSYSLQLLLWHP